ncbi:MAG: SDR family NAD(P)-dependent oxidoreductase [Gammaproteobacteria bacterium]|nr:SDR family NAD(P)-dependent oxidoreductase [Gammaproteobacteria bacterium]
MTAIKSFGRPVRALVVGVSGAIGGAFVDVLAADPAVSHVLAWSRTPCGFPSAKVEHRTVDVLKEESIRAALLGTHQIDLAIVATGLLHDPGVMIPEKSWRALDKDTLLRSFAVNTIGPALVAKHVLPLLPRRGKAVFAALSARVGSISDNRLGGWYGYRASKAALNQIIRTLAIELARQRKDAICVGLHPGTVDSGLSRPFQSSVNDGKLFEPSFAAERLLAVIDKLDSTSTGQLFAWDGQAIAP